MDENEINNLREDNAILREGRTEAIIKTAVLVGGSAAIFVLGAKFGIKTTLRNLPR